MVILKMKSFSRWAKSEALCDQQLRAAVLEIDAGMVDADLGQCLYKK